MRVFMFMEETGGGVMRRAKEGETLEDYLNETLLNEGLIESMTHGRTIPDDDYEPEPISPRPMDEEDLEPYAAADDAILPEYIAGYSEDEYILMWFEAEVPDWTRYVYNGGCRRDLGGYCGMGGAGYIELEDGDGHQ